jgi:CheY-like chemotaxis protein
MTEQLPCILYAEDDPNDIVLFQIALDKASLPVQAAFVSDGGAAIDYLSGASSFNDRERYPLPQLIVLDLKMPRKSGFDVLEWLRDRPELASIPTIILSSSEYPEDRARALSLGAKDYHVKPLTNTELSELLQHLCSEWLHEAKTVKC